MTEEMIHRLRYDCELALQLGGEACVLLPATDVRTIADRIEALAAEIAEIKRENGYLLKEQALAYIAQNERLRSALRGMIEYARHNERWQDAHPEYVRAARATLGETP